MSKNIPTNKELYSRVKALAKKKFDRWPSAYGSAWLVKEYKRRGGTYRKAQYGMEIDNPYADMYSVGGDYMYGGEEYSQGGMPEYKNGGIPERYRNMGFTRVGAKKKSTRPGKKWMVLAKKGDKYKVVHGGDSNMKDFKQHGSAKRKKRFWDRMGGRDSAKAKDPFSPLYWHKRFGTWAEGGEFEPHMMYDPETGKGFMAEKYEDHVKMDKMGFIHDAPEMGYGGDMYAKGGINNPGFRALPPEVQDKIRANMKMGGDLYQAAAGAAILPIVKAVAPTVIGALSKNKQVQTPSPVTQPPINIYNNTGASESQDSYMSRPVSMESMYRMGGMPCYECGGSFKRGGMPKYQFAGSPGSVEEQLLNKELMADMAEQTSGSTEAAAALNYGFNPLGVNPENVLANWSLNTNFQNTGYQSYEDKLNDPLGGFRANIDAAAGRLELPYGAYTKNVENLLSNMESKPADKMKPAQIAYNVADAASYIAGSIGKRNKEQRAKRDIQQRFMTDNLYTPAPLGTQGSRGDYNTFG